MKGVKGYLLSQFVIDEKNNIQFHWQQISGLDAQNEMEKLKNHICLMGEKYVLVRTCKVSLKYACIPQRSRVYHTNKRFQGYY